MLTGLPLDAASGRVPTRPCSFTESVAAPPPGIGGIPEILRMTGQSRRFERQGAIATSESKWTCFEALDENADPPAILDEVGGEVRAILRAVVDFGLLAACEHAIDPVA